MDDLAGLLVERGHTVTIVTASGEPSTEPEKRRGARVLRVRYPHLPAGRQPLGALSSLIAAARMRRWDRRPPPRGATDAGCLGRVGGTWPHLRALRPGPPLRAAVLPPAAAARGPRRGGGAVPRG